MNEVCGKLRVQYRTWKSGVAYMKIYHSICSLRRGYEVYRQVCSTCHSMTLVHFRELVGVTHTEEQAKLLAQQYEVRVSA